MQYKHYISTLFVLFFYAAYGQNTLNCDAPAPKEDIFLHTDRDRYIAGEDIWFKAYCLENKLESVFSKILYVELFDAKKNTFIQQKHTLANGTANGVLSIPSDLNTGHYFLRAYTQYQRNFPAKYLYTQVISVVNPNSEYKEVEIREQKSQKSADGDKTLPFYQKIKVTTAQKVYKQRALIQLSIDLPLDEKVNLSITVRKKGSGHDAITLSQFIDANPWLSFSYLFEAIAQQKTLFTFPTNKLAKNVNELKWMPEFRSLTISGIIRDKANKQALKNITCLSSVIGNSPQIHLATTHEDGSFIFSFNDLSEEHKLYVGIFPKRIAEIEILINTDFNTDFPKTQEMPLIFDANSHTLYENLSLHYQLKSSFEIKENSFSLVNKNDISFPFNLGKPHQVVDTKSFINLPSLEDIFREIVPNVSIYGRKGQRGLSVFNKDENFRSKTPLVLLDNVPVSDIEKLFLIRPDLVKSIEVYNASYVLGSHFLGGIVSIKTQTNNFAGFKWDDNSIFVPFTSPQPLKAFTFPDYRTSKTKSIPDFRTTLYWQANVNNETALQFYSGDDCGVYEIIIKGFSLSGVPYFGKTIISVEK